MALAAAALAQAERADMPVSALEAKLEKAEAKKEALKKEGGTDRVGVRMGWA